MKKLTGIEAARGVAALLVVSMHARDHLLKAGISPFIGHFVAFGHTGVDFFFVLSGFIILHVHASDIGSPSALKHYLNRRFTRIYPFYWVALLLSLLAGSIHHPLPSLAALSNSALLLPFAVALPVPVAWSMQHEIVFYALFATLITSRRAGLVLLGLWLALILSDVFAISAVPSGALVNLHCVFDLEFFLGMPAARLLQRSTVPAPRISSLLGIAVFAGLGALENMHIIAARAPMTHLGYGLAAMVIVLGIVEAERQGQLHPPRALVALGGASYALYLTHLLTVGAIWQILLAAGLTRTIPGWMELMLFIGSSVATGLIASRAVEIPVMAFARRTLSTLGRWPGVAAPATRQRV